MSGDIAEATHEEAEVIASEGGSVFSRETAYSSLPSLACPGIRDVPIRSGTLTVVQRSCLPASRMAQVVTAGRRIVRVDGVRRRKMSQNG